MVEAGILESKRGKVRLLAPADLPADWDPATDSRLYTMCERKKRAAEALSYNGLVQSWPEIDRLAREGGKSKATQTEMNFGDED